jgi:hypothetical protein
VSTSDFQQHQDDDDEDIPDTTLESEIEDAEELADDYENAHEDITTEREAFELELMDRGESEAGEFVHVLDED